ncbi:MAG: hypothetical protein ACOC0V_02210 [Oceanicaulis sp.]
MSGPKPNPKPDPNYGDVDPKDATAPTTREEQLKSPEVRGDVPAGSSATPGRSGGEIARDLATKDELEQEFEIEGKKTRVHKSEEQTVPKDDNEANRPGERRNPDEDRGLRNKSSSRKS